jgi:hypothetical protein
MERLRRLGMSPAEAARIAGIGCTLLKREIRNRRLIARKVGRRTVITSEDLAAWLKGLPQAGGRLGRVTDGFVPPQRVELGDNDPSTWDDANDPWALQNMLPLEDAKTGEFLVFVSNSFGGKLAIEKLCNRVARDLKAGRDRGSPTIKLPVNECSTKGFGEVQRPDFVIVGWENNKQEPVLAPSDNELNDSIPS